MATSLGSHKAETLSWERRAPVLPWTGCRQHGTLLFWQVLNILILLPFCPFKKRLYVSKAFYFLFPPPLKAKSGRQEIGLASKWNKTCSECSPPPIFFYCIFTSTHHWVVACSCWNRKVFWTCATPSQILYHGIYNRSLFEKGRKHVGGWKWRCLAVSTSQVLCILSGACSWLKYLCMSLKFF